jgi:rare lipoprotein A
MSAVASSAQHNEGFGTSPSVRCGQAAIVFALGIVLLSGIARTDDDESVVVSIKDLDADVVVVSLANVGFPAKSRADMRTLDDAGSVSARSETSHSVKSASLSRPEPPAAGNGVAPDLVADDRHQALPKLFAAYRSLLKLVAVMGLPRSQDDAVRAHATIVGTASTYNPHRGGNDEGGMQTASGESYDSGAWTAAIHIDLRDQFGGVRYGRFYQPAYALVESGDKRAIVKINDVGPLRPGRVIDLNERSMRYFDPSLERGLLSDAKITLLPGADWTPGPVGGFELASFASAR